MFPATPHLEDLDEKCDMNAARLGVLLGADSLLGRRSGVGRMTLQIARALRRHPAIGALSLMIGSRAAGPELLDGLGDEAEPLPPPGEAPRLAALRARIAGAPGLPALRGIWMRRATDGRRRPWIPAAAARSSITRRT